MTRIDYASKYLSALEVRRLFEAAVFAFCIGKHLSRFLSIHLDAGGIVDRRGFISKFNKLAGEWLSNRTGCPSCYLWVLEKPIGGQYSFSRGFNVHILIHVPHSLHQAFYRKERDWLKASGAKSARGVCRSRQIDFSGSNCPGGAYLREGLFGVIRYITKGIEPNSAYLFGIEAEPQGAICGKRSGYSESLAKRHMWKHQFRQFGRVNISMPYGSSRRRRFVALPCPELLGLPAICEDDLGWE